MFFLTFGHNNVVTLKTSRRTYLFLRSRPVIGPRGPYRLLCNPRDKRVLSRPRDLVPFLVPAVSQFFQSGRRTFSVSFFAVHVFIRFIFFSSSSIVSVSFSTFFHSKPSAAAAARRQSVVHCCIPIYRGGYGTVQGVVCCRSTMGGRGRPCETLRDAFIVMTIRNARTSYYTLFIGSTPLSHTHTHTLETVCTMCLHLSPTNRKMEKKKIKHFYYYYYCSNKNRPFPLFFRTILGRFEWRRRVAPIIRTLYTYRHGFPYKIVIITIIIIII